MMDEGESASESIDRLGYTIAPRAAQFDEIAGGGNGDEEAAAVPQNPPEFHRIHTRRDRQNDGERPIRIGHHAIGIRNYPLAVRVAPRGCVNGRDRDIDPMRIAPGIALESAEVETIAAAGIENHVAGSRGDGFRDGQTLMLSKSPVM